MPTAVAITLTGICAGQNHIHLSVTVNGQEPRAFSFEVDELAEPLTVSDIRPLALDILRMHFRGRTKAQAKAELQAGIAMVI